eukprot:Opistho-2@22745
MLRSLSQSAALARVHLSRASSSTGAYAFPASRTSIITLPSRANISVSGGHLIGAHHSEGNIVSGCGCGCIPTNRRLFGTNATTNDGRPFHVPFEELAPRIKEAEKTKKGDFVLVDVRTDAEVQQGIIPTAVHIPLNQLPVALQGTSAADFESKYKTQLPDKKAEIIFYCKSGVRSESAAQLAKTLGYDGARSYRGSWTEWSEKALRS